MNDEMTDVYLCYACREGGHESHGFGCLSADCGCDVDTRSKSDLRRFGFGPEHDRLFVVIDGELWESVDGERVVRWVPDESTRVKSAAQAAARSDSEDPS